MFITFEGIEGSGKGTMLERTVAWLRGQPGPGGSHGPGSSHGPGEPGDIGREVLQTREPGGSGLGLSLRSLLLDARNSGIAPEAELFLYLADRAQHVNEVIRPALAAGSIVISDRYADSTIVYQGYGRGLDLDELFRLNDFAVKGLWPDLTLVLDLEVETGLERARRRNQQLGLEEKEGRFEAESMAFHSRVRTGYRAWAARHPERVRIIDGSGGPDEVFARVQAELSENI